MGDFSKSVKNALSRVFGRGDLEEVLGEEWEFTDSQSMPVAAAIGKVNPPPETNPPGIEAARPTDLRALANSSPAPSKRDSDSPGGSVSPPPTVSATTTAPSERSSAHESSAALNKWLRPRAPQGCVIHSFRHSLRDRLREVECPADVIDAIGGWATEGVGHQYGKGHSLKVTHGWMKSLVR